MSAREGKARGRLPLAVADAMLRELRRKGSAMPASAGAIFEGMAVL
jgi:hypothetical protein